MSPAPPLSSRLDRARNAGVSTLEAIEAEIQRHVLERGIEKSICPSEVARALAPAWRPLRGPVRAAAARLARQGRLEILRKGKAIDPDDMHGVIRLRALPDGNGHGS